ncbi:MAG TPA: hypothetical protein PK845_04865 [Petrotogaceae bacterium]|nr:hypothetical protein [Petrotogaceae bacterium]HQI78807.1 hypothetical protein [Petrotogaceae bacterium]
MPKYIKVCSYIIILFFLFSGLTNFFLDMYFQSQPYYYMGKVPFENNLIKETDRYPEYAKAVIIFEEEQSRIKVLLPKGSGYMNMVLKDVQNINYSFSKVTNTVVTSYVQETDLFKPTRFFMYRRMVNNLIVSFFIVLCGYILKPFSPGRYMLVRFKYYSRILSVIISFALFCAVTYFSSFISFFGVTDGFFPVIIGVVAVLAGNIFSYRILQWIISIAALSLIFFDFASEYRYFILGGSFVLNIIVGYCMIKTHSYIRTIGSNTRKKENKNKEESVKEDNFYDNRKEEDS